jgi:hypothetical protein
MKGLFNDPPSRLLPIADVQNSHRDLNLINPPTQPGRFFVCRVAHNRLKIKTIGRHRLLKGAARESRLRSALASSPLRPGGFFFCSCRARRSAGFPSPAAGFEVRPKLTKDRADFSLVWESDHTIAVVQGDSPPDVGR